MDLYQELNKTRQRWMNARDKNDSIMMGLWERYGKLLKRKIFEKNGNMLK